ncbi:MAG: copper amine oxidase N-terminal domain-containing protein [Syntrophomonadaceae bacterium]
MPRISKKFALLLVLAMLASMFAGMGIASADDTTYGTYTGTYKYVTADDNRVAGTFAVTEKGGVAVWAAGGATVYAKVTLPSGVKYAKKANDAGVTLANYVTTTGAAPTLNDCDRQMTEIAVDATGAADTVTFLFGTADESALNIDAGFSGDVNATIQIYSVLGGAVQWEESYTRTIAKVSATGVTVTTGDTTTVKAGTSRTVADVILKEATAGTIANGEAINLVPDDTRITFDTVGSTEATANFTLAAAPVETTTKLTQTITTGSSAQPGKITFSPKLNIPPGITGDITLTVYSDTSASKLKQTSIKVATIGENSANITNIKDATKTIYTGTGYGTLDATFDIKANTGSVIESGKMITIDLPNGKFDPANPPNLGAQATFQSAYNDNHTVWYVVAAGNPTKISVSTIKVTTDPGVNGDIKLTLGGDAGVSGDVVVGQFKDPFTATALSTPQVIPNAINQAGGDIEITEVAGKALATNTLIQLRAPEGVKFSTITTPVVTVGNMTVGDKTLLEEDTVWQFKVISQSSIASTIKISGIKYDLSKSVIDGDLQLSIRGGVGTVNSKAWGKVVNAVVGSIGAVQKSVFTIGAAKISVNGKEVDAIAPAYIKDGRTYLSIVDAARVLGVNDANILWDPANQTVTLLKGDKVVQVKIGSKILKVNGAEITMDVAPEISNNRTCLPVGLIAQAFGATVTWDPAAQTITIQ